MIISQVQKVYELNEEVLRPMKTEMDCSSMRALSVYPGYQGHEVSRRNFPNAP